MFPGTPYWSTAYPTSLGVRLSQMPRGTRREGKKAPDQRDRVGVGAHALDSENRIPTVPLLSACPPRPHPPRSLSLSAPSLLICKMETTVTSLPASEGSLRDQIRRETGVCCSPRREATLSCLWRGKG